jgi:hypothetical protein
VIIIARHDQIDDKYLEEMFIQLYKDIYGYQAFLYKDNAFYGKFVYWEDIELEDSSKNNSFDKYEDICKSIKL